jgi:hypothetical protein
MFRPYLAIVTQLFTFRNHHITSVRNSKYFNAIAVSSVTIRLSENITLYPFLRYFPLVASVFFVLNSSLRMAK